METGYAEGCTVSTFYDPLLAKVIAHAPYRAAVLDALADALRGFEVTGVKTNIPFLLQALSDLRVRAADLHTSLAEDIVAGPG